MRHQVGEKSLSIWLEFLSIADRNEGEIPGDLEELIRSVAGKCQVTVSTVRAVYQFALTRLWLNSDNTLRTRNHAKYHPSRDAKRVPSFLPNLPNLNLKIKKKIIHPISTKWGDPEKLIEKYNSETPAALPAVEKITPARLKKAREYLRIFPDESFWTEAFREIGKSDFLQGMKNANGHSSFKANFDWLLTKGKDGTENIVKTFEGRYGNGK